MEVAKAMNYMDQYKFWLEDSYFDEGTKEELRKIADNQAEIEDRFYKDLAAGVMETGRMLDASGRISAPLIRTGS